MKGILILFLILLYSGIFCSEAQNSYTQVQFNYRVEKDIVYATDINFAGLEDTLTCDLYKPIGDANINRPLAILVHGGAWIGGSKNDQTIEYIAIQLAKRGYNVASINYRLGMHLSKSGGSSANCPIKIDNRIYVADSMEVVRAIYRGMQDLKAAIRFFKSRFSTDSTCNQNIYLIGESAGSIIVYQTALMESNLQRSNACGTIPDAETPHSSLVSLLPKGYQLQRPDLGFFEGNKNLNGYDSKVQGIACFYGSIVQPELLQKKAKPVIYMFHQTSDVVVDCGRTHLLASMSYNCLDPFGFAGCAHIWNMPMSYGSCSILDSLILQKTDTARYVNNIVKNTGPNCLQNPPGHSIDNINLRIQNLSNLFSKEIQKVESDSLTTCHEIPSNIQIPSESQIQIYPNPFSSDLNIILPNQSTAYLKIYNISGQLILNKLLNQYMNHIEMGEFNSGLYIVDVTIGESTFHSKVIKL